jgi:ribosomal protein S3AE
MVTKKKLKTKKWVKIVAPKMFNECELGESLVMEPKSLIGRVITVPLSTLIGDFSKQHMLLSFKIDDIKENIAQTSVKNFTVSKSHIIRRTRRRSTKADSVETITIKDNKKAIIKTVVITPFRTQKFQKRSLLVALKENLENMCKNYNFEALILALCSNKLQADLQTKLKKVYPVKYLEIRSLEMVKK